MANGQPDGYDVFLSFVRAPDGALQPIERISRTLAQLDSGLDIRNSRPLDEESTATGDLLEPEGACVFVAVLSPDYLASTSAMEGAKFALAARKRPGPGEPPIFLLAESPLDDAQIPIYLQDARTYEAFGADGVPTELHLNKACMDLAFDVSAALADAKTAAVSSAEPESQAGRTKTVFLAHTHKSLHQDRKQVLDELRGRGFLVAPQADEGATPEQIVAATNKISEATVSVHLLNGAYDEAAAEEARAAEGKTRRLVWIEPDSDPHNSTMKDLLADVERAKEGTTPYGNSLEEFRKQLLVELSERAGTPASENASIPTPSSTDLLDIYIYYESSDAKQTQRLVDFLDRHDCITWPSMYGPETETTERVKHHDEVMSFCDGVLVVAGNAPFPSWLQRIRSENRKGWPDRPLACCYFDPLDQPKQEFTARDVSFIVAGSGLPPEAQTALQKFLETVRQRAASTVE